MAGIEADAGPLDTLLGALQLKYEASGPDSVFGANREEQRQKFLDFIIENRMVPYYNAVWVNELRFPSDAISVSKLAELNAENDKKLAAIESRIQDAEDNLGDKDVRDAWLDKITHFVSTGDKDNAIFWTAEALALFEKTASLGVRLDLVLQQVRVGLGFQDTALVTRSLRQANDLCGAKGADWERRNRMRVYEAIQGMIERDFGKSGEVLRGAIATFTASEVCPYPRFLEYSVITSVTSLDRADLKKKVLANPDIIAVARGGGEEAAGLRKALALARVLQDCNYGDFFDALHAVCRSMLRDVWLHNHVQHFYREARVIGFRQFLSAYEKVQLSQMSEAFGVEAHVLDAQLASFTAARRLDCAIDEIDGVVHMLRADRKGQLCEQYLRQMDTLLAKVQKVARLVEA
eukprot:TRINITY_DN34347_c0_g1_i1.p1 TRINITY_DN34347_c0_g1~~TRINITY_DN34347_c0_g1_i1.p1  ORF type:complete len:406 (-),score=111.75 TRINITY_DN34347_c0_g1_i1:137-1354(-)